MVAEDRRAGLHRHRQFLGLALRRRRAADRAGSQTRRDFGYTKRNIIANPNCSTAQLVVALKPLHDHAKIKRIVVSTYQSVSGAGKDGMDELFNQTRAVFVADPITSQKFTKRIAFNVIPHIDDFMEDGYTKEEWKVLAETKKMLDPKIKVTCTAVRVPVFIGHSESVNIEFENEISAEEARNILRDAPGCQVIDKHEDGGYITPYECAGEDATFISRIREDATVENGLNMWVVSDNLRKGAALNTIQIAELLVNRRLINPRAAGLIHSTDLHDPDPAIAQQSRGFWLVDSP
jgi:aspartate-semialdehyde dehydrogenase